MQSMVTEAICMLLREREREREVNVLGMVEANGKRNENVGVFMDGVAEGLGNQFSSSGVRGI